MIKIYKLLLREMKRKKEKPKETNVSTLKVGENYLANPYSDVRNFGSYAMRNCALPLDLTTETGFLAENIQKTRCKLKVKFYKTLCFIKCMKIF
jgi:hypothetical protein